MPAKIISIAPPFNDIHTVNGVAVVGKLALSEEVLRRERLLNQNVQLIPAHRPDPFKYRAAGRYAQKFDESTSGRKAPDFGHLRDVAAGWDDIAIAIPRRVRGQPNTTCVHLCQHD